MSFIELDSTRNRFVNLRFKEWLQKERKKKGEFWNYFLFFAAFVGIVSKIDYLFEISSLLLVFNSISKTKRKLEINLFEETKLPTSRLIETIAECTLTANEIDSLPRDTTFKVAIQLRDSVLRMNEVTITVYHLQNGKYSLQDVKIGGNFSSIKSITTLDSERNKEIELIVTFVSSELKMEVRALETQGDDFEEKTVFSKRISLYALARYFDDLESIESQLSDVTTLNKAYVENLLNDEFNYSKAFDKERNEDSPSQFGRGEHIFKSKQVNYFELRIRSSYFYRYEFRKEGFDFPYNEISRRHVELVESRKKGL